MNKEMKKFVNQLEQAFGVNIKDFEDTFFGKRLREFICKNGAVIKSNNTILFKGESGSGKSFYAKLIHNISPRRDKEMLSIDCSQYKSTESLFRNEVFGYDKGAFTGAYKSKPGFLELADNSSFCFENIEDLPLEVQGNLRLFLDTGTFFRVGGTEKKQVDVRIMTTSVEDIEELIEEGNFNEQLYNRINKVIFNVPTLREREEDEILHFIKLFINKACCKYKKSIISISKQFIDFVTTFSWSDGNLRSLNASIDTAVANSKDKIISLQLLISTFNNKKSAIEEIWKIYGKDFDSLNLNQKKILIEYAFNSIINTKIIRKKFRVSKETANKWLREMEENAFLEQLTERKGKGGICQYRIPYPFLSRGK